jgi:hypothetical protein
LLLIQESQQQARKVERDLFHTLEKIYKYRIKRDPDFPLYTSSIHSKYYNLVLAAIRKAIETVHREGIEYVGSKLKQEVYFTDTDIDTIKVQAEFTTNLFFKALSKEAEIIQREQNNVSLKGAAEVELVPHSESEINEEVEPIDVQTGVLAIIKRLVVSAITISFAKSILSKTNQLPTGLSFTRTGDFSHKVRWVTQTDERVCPICFQLHNQIFYTNNAATIPLPGTLGTLGSHPNCRCYYVLIQ